MLLALDFVRVLDDRLLAIDLELLELVAEHAFDGLALVSLGNCLDGARYSYVLLGDVRLLKEFLVATLSNRYLVSGFHQPESSFGSIVGC